MTSAASQPVATAATLIDDHLDLATIEPSWDALAISAGAPLGAPAWALGWWRHLAPPRASLAVIAVYSGVELIGVAPFYALRRLGITELRLLSGGLASRLGILAVPGTESEVASAVAKTLADRLAPDIVHWEGIDVGQRWDKRLSDEWPGGKRPHDHESDHRSAPVIHLSQNGYEAWLAEKGGKFRREVRRRQRKLEEAGATSRLADFDSLECDLSAFARLHFSRWEGRGGSSVPVQAISMLEEVGRSLLPEGRFRLWMIDGPDGEAISARILVSAGGVVAAWNKGFDPGWSRYAPGILSAHTAIEDAFNRGDDLFDLGGGETDDKQRLADADQEIVWASTFMPGARYPLARLKMMPQQVIRQRGKGLRARLGDRRFHQIRGFVKRPR